MTYQMVSSKDICTHNILTEQTLFKNTHRYNSWKKEAMNVKEGGDRAYRWFEGKKEGENYIVLL